MSDSSKLPSEVPFASFFVYSPRPVDGEGEAGQKSRRLVRSIKNEARAFAVKWSLAEFVREHLDEDLRQTFLGPGATLVPMPGHAPMKDQAARWPARELCEELVKVGLGRQWMPLLSRTRRVNKAAFSPPDERPTAAVHFETLRCDAQLGVADEITVVDDVITRGASMLAAIGSLRLAYPAARVQGFAFIRTLSDVPIDAVVAPVEGTVELVGDGTRRRP